MNPGVERLPLVEIVEYERVAHLIPIFRFCEYVVRLRVTRNASFDRLPRRAKELLEDVRDFAYEVTNMMRRPTRDLLRVDIIIEAEDSPIVCLEDVLSAMSEWEPETFNSLLKDAAP